MMKRIGNVEIDLVTRKVYRAGSEMTLGTRAFDILEVLILADGKLVSKDEILQKVWSDCVVEENNVHVHISAIRRAFGKDRDLITTVSRRGYRLKQCEATPGTGEPSRAKTEATRHNLPRTPGKVLGREHAVATLSARVGETRLLTLLGAGGIGKTRLAVALGFEALPNFSDGVFLVSLDSVSCIKEIVAKIAEATLAGSAQRAHSLASLAQALTAKKALLILDGCELLADAVAHCVDAVLKDCPGIHTLVTSRVPLNLSYEARVIVPPLSSLTLVAAAKRAPECGAVELFLARFFALSGGNSMSEAGMAAVREVCNSLDGVPLAIELAAEAAAIAGLDAFAGDFEQRILALESRMKDLPAHQRTLKANFLRSENTLCDLERVALRRLAVFPRAFDASEAVRIAADSQHDAASVEHALALLAEKSLLLRRQEGMKTRFEMFALTRIFAQERLAACGEAADMQRKFDRLRTEQDGPAARVRIVANHAWPFAESQSRVLTPA
ncbi:winged helix-turn-helix domain-containing protein [Paraburkholderia sp. CNPSo 3272]|uniref:winged helix-turn-helix domain-containing protein n=1 Tax=Paraburkholderia sp. CNPSo 3272 TaxID=2940931 RepID=UPI0020B64003|nr:winged helix-turn-helix domain-containing protein [Paraburkholderia sp. CNPSo 3272]MCP3724327.1 winged helix-turn-helix domain-containing protein [Paraburkholderia sp. CNPSo 3272]